MAQKKRKKRSKHSGMLGWVFDAFQIIWDLIPMRAVATTLIIGGMAGGLIGYNVGIGAGTDITCPACDACGVCEICEDCECEECTDCPDCPACPKALENYTCSEINELRNDCDCIPL